MTLKEGTMKRFALSIVICACLLWPLAATAETPFHGIWTRKSFDTEYPEEPHPKKLKITLAITQEFVDNQGAALPLYFGARYANGYDERKPVVFKVRVYRGNEVLWKAKRRMNPVDADYRLVFCKTYDESLLAGDLVVFNFKFPGRPRPGEVQAIRLYGLVSPKEIWEGDPRGLWPLGDQFWDCP